MFTNDTWANHGCKKLGLARVRDSYTKKGVDLRLRREFDIAPNDSCAAGIVRTALSLAASTTLTCKKHLTVWSGWRSKA